MALVVRRSFKRCREGTVDAIIDFQRTGDPESVTTIVRGIVWRYVHKDVQSRVDQATAETPLASLGIDSLTMMEIVLDVQDVHVTRLDNLLAHVFLAVPGA